MKYKPDLFTKIIIYKAYNFFSCLYYSTLTLTKTRTCVLFFVNNVENIFTLKMKSASSKTYPVF